MHAEEIEKAKQLIRTSDILSSVEKAEWVQLLADMNDKQILELVKILTPIPAAPTLPTPPKPAMPQVPAFQMPVNIKQKEISSNIPFYEKELPAPHKQEEIKQVRPTDPTDLQNRVENIVRELQHKPPVVPSAPIPASVQVKAVSLHNPDIEISDITDTKDFVLISPSNLHEREPNAELQKILVVMAAAGKAGALFEAIKTFEKSPLYKTYLALGLALLNDASPNRDAVYAEIVEDMKKRGEPWMSKVEFEAFADFRKRLEQMI